MWPSVISFPDRALKPTVREPLPQEPLAGLRAPCVLLEDRINPAAPALLYRNPDVIIRCDDPAGVNDALSQIEAGLARGLHAAGLFSYELGYALEPKLAPRMPAGRTTPLIWVGLFAAPEKIWAGDLDDAFATLGPPPPITGLQAGHDRGEHVGKVREILKLISAGDVYQVNLTFPMRFNFGGNPLALYAALRASQPVSHGGVALLGDMAVLSVSPELWIDVQDSEATTRPMKGTIARGKDARADAQAMRTLQDDPKQRAENLMIVDLLRNDLSRISQVGSVRVPAQFVVETYPSFHTLTSTVTSQLNPDVSLRDKLTALFPCGSIVGAPKIRAGEIIHDLESEERGFYTGALGRIAPNGDMNFNVAIRTAVIASDGRGQFGVGGGIVADSNPDSEYDEALLKARVLSNLAAEFGLIETFRWSRSAGFVRLPLHLDRLAASARQLEFTFARHDIEQRLAELGATFGETDQRVRVLLHRNGDAEITHAPAAAAVARPLRVRVSKHRVDSADPYLRYKTTRREIYDTEFSSAEAAGFDEVLFLNQHGCISEASRNTFFARIGDRLVTPALSCGLLPGVFRQSLIANGEAAEGRLTMADLAGATALFLGNSLHGLREMHLVREHQASAIR